MRRMHPVWTLVLCAGAMLAINMGIRQTFGLYLKPISQDLDLTARSLRWPWRCSTSSGDWLRLSPAL